MNGPAAAPDYEIVGELGRTGEGAAWLARERSTDELVALHDPEGGGAPVVSRVLGSDVPSSVRSCPICREPIRDWRRYCGQCGTDLSGVDVAPDGLDPRDVLESVLSSVEKPVELLGSMRRSEGGGAVWFGRNRQTGEVLALDLTRKGGGTGFDVKVTATLRAFDRPDRSSAATAPSEPDAPASPEPDAAVRVCPTCGKEYPGGTRFCPDDGSTLRAREGQDTLVGEVIASRYEILRRLGRGGMGQVFQARHIRMGRLCAIKLLNQELTDDAKAIGRFSREATNASRINHMNVAHIYDFGESPEHGVYLAMEYVDGEPLSKIIAAEAPLANERVIAIALQVADALDAAHAEGVVHRDLTPNNIMIAKANDGSDLVKVVDFGIAKATHDMNASLTQTGVVIGTPQYMSPEQLMADPVDGRSDIYSMGCVLFELLTGRGPFGGATTLDQLTRRLTETPPAPGDVNTDVWPDLSALVFRALARRREDRFESAASIRIALRGIAPPTRGTELAGGATAGDLVATQLTPPRGRPAAPRPAARSAPVPPAATTDSPPGERLPGEDAGAGVHPTAPGRRPIPFRQPIPVRLLAGIGGALAIVAVIWALGRGDGPPPPTPSPTPEDPTVTGTTAPVTPAPPPPGVIRLGVALPPGAIVRANGDPVSVDGDRIELAPGDYRLEVQAEGFEPATDQLTLTAGEERTWTPGLRRVPAAAQQPAAPTPRPQQQAETQPPPLTAAPPQRPPVDATSRTNVAQPEPVGPVPVSFADASRSRIEAFRASLEARNLDAIRNYLTASEIRQFTGVFERAGSRPLAVSVRAMVPDSADLRTTFLLRIDVAGGGENLMMWTDFVAVFQKRGDLWGLRSVGSSQPAPASVASGPAGRRQRPAQRNDHDAFES